MRHAMSGELRAYLLDQLSIQATEISDRFAIGAAMHRNHMAGLADQFQGPRVIESMTGNVEVTIVILFKAVETEEIVVDISYQGSDFSRMGFDSAAMGGDNRHLAATIDHLNSVFAFLPFQRLIISILVQIVILQHISFLLLTKATITD